MNPPIPRPSINCVRLHIPPLVNNRVVGGFSLVEVVVAVGLVTFAVVAVLGVLPTGITTLRKAMDQTVESQIVRTIGAEAVSGEFSSVAAKPELFFDEEGQSSEASTDSYYVAKVSAKGAVYPASSISDTIPDSLKTLRIELAVRHNTNDLPRVFCVNVANNGKS